MERLDELLWSCGGNGERISDSDWKRIHDHILAKLNVFLGAPAILDGLPSVRAGFSTSFTTADDNNCLKHRLWGTFGVDFPGGEYACVQGFVYAYKDNHRVVLASGENHIYIRYARTDADDNDWSMSACSGHCQSGPSPSGPSPSGSSPSGSSQWRTYGWSDDPHGEFEGFETWPDRLA